MQSSNSKQALLSEADTCSLQIRPTYVLSGTLTKRKRNEKRRVCVGGEWGVRPEQDEMTH